MAIAYPGQTGKATAFAYDGLGRRLTITSTPAGGGAVATNYLWCGYAICQARDASNTATRAYYDEGEFSPGADPQSVYYGVDQIGSTRRAFVSSTNAPAYSYDPWGNELSGTVKATDFGFAGMAYNADSGLSLTQYRAYDPNAGHWISRDPIADYSIKHYPVSVDDTFESDNILPIQFRFMNNVNNFMLSSVKYSAMRLPLYDPYQWILLFDGPTLYGYVRQNPLIMTDRSGLAGVDGFEEMKAEQFISLYCQAGILSVFPGQFLGCPIGDIQAAAACGDPMARRAMKLLKQGRFRK